MPLERGQPRPCRGGAEAEANVSARLAGTNVEEGKRLIAESGLPLIEAEDLGTAARKAVEAAQAA